jgi:hypothetical protein
MSHLVTKTPSQVFMDISDIIHWNIGLLNTNNLSNSFFCLSKNDPTHGFSFDATSLAGHAYGEAITQIPGKHYIIPQLAKEAQERHDTTIRFPHFWYPMV